jgi:hypothetical protein
LAGKDRSNSDFRAEFRLASRGKSPNKGFLQLRLTNEIWKSLSR